MSLWAIVPVKPLRRGKSRLADVLSGDERTLLNSTMLGNTLKTLTSVPEVDQVMVISRDTAVLALARDFKVRTLQEDGSSDLNTALKRGTVVAQFYAARSVLILPADLPLLTKESLQTFLACASTSPVVVITPDRRKDGTNALLVRPPGLVDYRFGPGSFQRHIQQASDYNVHVEICDIPEISLDLDLPEDLDLLRQMEIDISV